VLVTRLSDFVDTGSAWFGPSVDPYAQSDPQVGELGFGHKQPHRFNTPAEAWSIIGSYTVREKVTHVPAGWCDGLSGESGGDLLTIEANSGAESEHSFFDSGTDYTALAMRHSQAGMASEKAPPC
jgi:hypothetical protein